MQIEVVTSFYRTENKDRMNELIKALRNNLNSKYISKVHLFLNHENYKPIHPKIHICGVGKQPLYSDLFSYCNTLKNKICMVINSDIWLHSIENTRIFNRLEENNGKTVFSLTRHEHDFLCPLIDNYQGSHDAFIFRSPICESIIKNIKHKQNIWCSENVVLYEIIKANYHLYNPCKQIIIVHEHKSEVREKNRERFITKKLGGAKPLYL